MKSLMDDRQERLANQHLAVDRDNSMAYRKLTKKEHAAVEAANAVDDDDKTPYALLDQAICYYFDALTWPQRKRLQCMDYEQAKLFLLETCLRCIYGI